MSSSIRLDEISVVIINYNGAKFLPACLEALDGSDSPYRGRFHELLVLDNASQDNSREITRPFEQTGCTHWLDSGGNLGYSGGANLAFKVAKGKYVALMNPDVVVGESCFENLWLALQSPKKVGIAGCRLIYPHEVQEQAIIQHLGGTVPYPLALTKHMGAGEPESRLAAISLPGKAAETIQGNILTLAEMDYVTGALVLVNREAALQIGGFDTSFGPAYYEETDFCLRLWQTGWRVVTCLEARAIHFESGGTGKASANYFYLYHLNRLRFVFKHYSADQLLNDFLPAEEERCRGVWSEAGGSNAASDREIGALEKVYFQLFAELGGSNSARFTSPDYTPGRERALDLFMRQARLESNLEIINRRHQLISREAGLPLPPLDWKQPRNLLFALRERAQKLLYRRLVEPHLLKLAARQELFNAAISEQLRELSAVASQLIDGTQEIIAGSGENGQDRPVRLVGILRETVQKAAAKAKASQTPPFKK